MPYHIRAKPGDVARSVIAVGDPSRAELLSSLLEGRTLVNSNRGLLTYTGLHEGIRVTVATHGIGSPSALIVFEELAMLGARRIVRLGTAGSLQRSLSVGDVLVASAAFYTAGGCGLQQYLNGVCGATGPHPLLTARILEELERRGVEYRLGPVFSSDSFYAETEEFVKKLSKLGALAVEMETAALFTLGWIRGLETSSVLVISNSLVESEARSDESSLREKFVEVARAVLSAFKRIAPENL